MGKTKEYEYPQKDGTVIRVKKLGKLNWGYWFLRNGSEKAASHFLNKKIAIFAAEAAFRSTLVFNPIK